MSVVAGSAPTSPYASAPGVSNDASRNAATRVGSGPAPASAATYGVADKTADVPSSTVTLSPQALAAMAHQGSTGSPATSTPPNAAPAAVPVASDASPSIYDAMKHGVSNAVDDVGNVASEAWHGLTSGVEAVVSGADTLVHGVADLPFVVVAKSCDAAAAVLDAL